MNVGFVCLVILIVLIPNVIELVRAIKFNSSREIYTATVTECINRDSGNIVVMGNIDSGLTQDNVRLYGLKNVTIGDKEEVCRLDNGNYTVLETRPIFYPIFCIIVGIGFIGIYIMSVGGV